MFWWNNFNFELQNYNNFNSTVQHLYNRLMCFKKCATSCLDKSLITKRVRNLTNKKMVHISLLDYRLSDQAFRNRCANRMYRESERHVKLHVKLSFLSTLSLKVFLDSGNFLFNLPVLLFQSSSITNYMRS